MVGTFPRLPHPAHPGRLLILPLLAFLFLGLGLANEPASSQAAPAKADAAPVPDKPKDPAKTDEPVKPVEPVKVVLPAAVTKAVPESVADLKAIQDHVKAILAKVTPAVVCVRIGAGSGSGVIVSADGYVLTAGHVSGEPGRTAVLVMPDGREVKAKSLGCNKGIDSGMLKITDEGKWPFVDLGKSGDLKKGQWCLTIGHPGGYKPGRTPVVRLGRVLKVTDSVVQTDCTLVGGDSGGPLFDMAGKVIGIHSRIGGTIVDNIHVPVDTYTETWDRLVKGESWGSLFGGRPAVNAPFMGVEIDRDAEGVKIARIVEVSPAEKAGLKADHMILEFNGAKLGTPDDLTAQIGKKKINDEVSLKVQRDKETLTLKLKLGRRPS